MGDEGRQGLTSCSGQVLEASGLACGSDTHPPFWDSISFLACSRMLLMASSEPVSGVRILGVILPGGGKGASVVGTCLLWVSPWSWAG